MWRVKFPHRASLRGARAMHKFDIDPLNLCTPSAVIRVLREHRIHPNRLMGQHFIVDRNVLRRIINAAELSQDDYILEIGTGLGTLTAALAHRARWVLTVEKDERLANVADVLLRDMPNVEVVNADFLEINIGQALSNAPNRHHENRWKVIANLPYYVSKPILMRLIEHRQYWNVAVLTVQREVAERLCAQPSSKAYGVLSIAIQLYADVEMIGNVAPQCFFPPPKVASTTIRLWFHTEPKVDVCDEALFFAIVNAAFAERRKQVVNSLLRHVASIQWSRDEWEQALRDANIPSSARAEQISIEQFAHLTHVVKMSQRRCNI